MKVEQLSANKSFDGMQLRYKHYSEANACDMTFSIYLPPKASKQKPVGVIYWLSGLTCTDENFVQKAGAQRYAANHNVAIVAPDTSPRGDGVNDDPEGAWDFGLGAGFYVDATQPPWSKHYQMYSYVSLELPTLIGDNFPVDTNKQAIMGHSMGGHGAMIIALKNKDHFRSVSAFAPIAAPTRCPWGKKAFTHYLGSDENAWQEYDTCELIKKGANRTPLLVDQGGDDTFIQEQLLPDALQKACKEANHPLTFRMQSGYDHSYFFIASFIEDHIAYHAAAFK